jgi:hypothetical protein
MLTKGVLSSGSEIPYGRGGATPLSGKPATKPFSLPAKSLEAFQGTYWIEATQAMRKIVLDKDKRDPREDSILLSSPQKKDAFLGTIIVPSAIGRLKMGPLLERKIDSATFGSIGRNWHENCIF